MRRYIIQYHDTFRQGHFSDQIINGEVNLQQWLKNGSVKKEDKIFSIRQINNPLNRVCIQKRKVKK